MGCVALILKTALMTDKCHGGLVLSVRARGMEVNKSVEVSSKIMGVEIWTEGIFLEIVRI